MAKKQKIDDITKEFFGEFKMNSNKQIKKLIKKYDIIEPNQKLMFTFGFLQGSEELQKYKIFHDHVKSHFEKEYPDWEVKCKICDKNFSEIIKGVKKNV